MLLLPQRNDIPKWVREHKAIKEIPADDREVLSLHEQICEQEAEALLKYHKMLAENPFREEVRISQHYMINKLKKMQAMVKDRLVIELTKYRMLEHDSLVLCHSVDESLVDEHIKRCIAYRVSAPVVHFILISHKFAKKIALLEEELVKYKHKSLDEEVKEVYGQVSMYKDVREALEKYMGGHTNKDMKLLADRLFPQHK